MRVIVHLFQRSIVNVSKQIYVTFQKMFTVINFAHYIEALKDIKLCNRYHYLQHNNIISTINYITEFHVI